MTDFEVPDWDLGTTSSAKVEAPKASKSRDVKSQKKNQKQKNAAVANNKSEPKTSAPAAKKKTTETQAEPPKKKRKAQEEERVEKEDDEVEEPKHKKPAAMSALQLKMTEALAGGKFRWLNEQLYTTTGKEAFELIAEDPSLFDTYHSGFKSQVKSWPVNPVDYFIEYVKVCPKSKVIADFGCGEAKLSASVPHKVHSFDLHACNERVTVCDIANVPLAKNTIDIAIFSLSLMGTDYMKFLREAHRVLKEGGELKIAEVKSRFGSTNQFVEELRKLGFNLTRKEESNTMFILFDFIKSNRTPNYNAAYTLKPCRYKKR